MLRFMYLGQVREEKGVGHIVKASRLLIQKRRRFEVNIYGDYKGWEHDRFAPDLFNEIKRDEILSRFIKFHGNIENVDDAFALNDVHLAPSIVEEAFGLVVVEAKKNRRASIIYPSGGMRELVTDGIDGFVCEQKDLKLLSEKMDFFIENPQISIVMGLQAHASLEELGIDASKFQYKWYSVINKIISC
jgi:L-malate glycosyltransferase